MKAVSKFDQGRVLVAALSMAAIALAGCRKQEAPTATQPTIQSAPAVGLQSGSPASTKEESCKAIQAQNTNRATLNYELQNAGCPPVSLSQQ